MRPDAPEAIPSLTPGSVADQLGVSLDDLLSAAPTPPELPGVDPQDTPRMDMSPEKLSSGVMTPAPAPPPAEPAAAPASAKPAPAPAQVPSAPGPERTPEPERAPDPWTAWNTLDDVAPDALPEPLRPVALKLQEVGRRQLDGLTTQFEQRFDAAENAFKTGLEAINARTDQSLAQMKAALEEWKAGGFIDNPDALLEKMRIGAAALNEQALEHQKVLVQARAEADQRHAAVTRELTTEAWGVFQRGNPDVIAVLKTDVKAREAWKRLTSLQVLPNLPGSTLSEKLESAGRMALSSRPAPPPPVARPQPPAAAPAPVTLPPPPPPPKNHAAPAPPKPMTLEDIMREFAGGTPESHGLFP